ncbi:MAG: Cof-type HAD-IIB family hydrolase [Agathobacter sp.]|nr:Cof-type HAD-IIB family hydrolase [Agathobacter sp.]
MSQIKIVFFDIDGTLFKLHTNEISSKTLETLQKLRANGIKICIATGRSPMGLPTFEGIEFDAYLTYNGSYCYADNTTIFSNSIPKEDVKQILANAEKMGKPVTVALKSEMSSNGLDKDLEHYMAVENLDLEVSEDFEEKVEDEVYQVMLACSLEEYDAILENVKAAKIATWWDKAVDIIPANGGKGMGIAAMLKYYGFDKSEALAFGDGNNDIEMLQAVGTGVAMGNASTDLKEVADEICGDVGEDGIYHYCMKMGLI